MPQNLDPAESNPPPLVGTVIAVQANFCNVQIDPDVPEVGGKLILCTRRARLQKIGISAIVGDRVTIDEIDWQGLKGVVIDVFPRHSLLDRPPVANADRILLVFALAEPALDPFLLSKFLVKAESTGLQVSLCLNKSDLVSDKERQEWCDRLGEWGYLPIVISVETGLGVKELQVELDRQITVFAGHSGVGKSSLTNALIPDSNIRVATVSGKLSRGRHTTRHVQLFTMPTGGLIADTPGFNQPDIACAPTELAGYFPEIRQRLTTGNCQFNNCTHRDEPNCIVRGEWERYPHYLEFLADAIAWEQQLQSQPKLENNLKQKSSTGKKKFEPKLDSKYRQIARHTLLQSQGKLSDEFDDD
ncbi:small ribosomal subunit biogenesis GTPase RsgA [Chamaesiphon sp. GL140_3_metabinner_50]|uniref:small ribosomal subunit biogenesis GTPase RsgA n=1 Tax=Chamaesiphon sp. GL140_3_metabinner_50 TaxID=2970812 RepID=UPI0025E61B52|nr:small ribosomal subunit biogenesis GTPase RsgA [Chamaesiphon sp. GL140_3_metabinner_50]